MEFPDFKREKLLSDAAHMHEFAGSQAHDIWLEYVDRMIGDWTVRMRKGSKEAYDYHKGVLEGLEMAREIPRNVQAWAKALPT